MCRLVAYRGAPLSLEPLVFGGTHSLFEQSWAPRELLSGTVNADGWGVAWYHQGRPVRLASSRPVWHAAHLRDTLGTLRSGAAVAALRSATPGLPVDRTGVPPLRTGTWTFVLNGYLRDFRRRLMRTLHRQIHPDVYGEMQGVSDTETLFLLAMGDLRAGATPGEALAGLVERVGAVVREAGVDAQLTMVLTDAERTAAVRTGTEEATNTLYGSVRGPLAPEGTLLASEPLDGNAGWEPVPSHALVEVDAEGGVRVREGVRA